MISGRLYFKVLAILLFAGIYACTRYVIFGNVYWIQIPVYILNKAIAVAAVFALMLSALGNLRNQGRVARDWGIITLHLTIYHVLLSLMIMTPNYYDFYWNDVLTLEGNLVMSFGALGTYSVVMLYMSRAGTTRMAVFKVLASFSIGAHIALMAWSGWLQPERWYGHMPPISLWSFLFTLVAFGIYLKLEDAKIEAAAVNER
jgi:hypothetical protein